MRNKITRPFIVVLMFLVGVFCVALISIFIPHASESSLARNFQNHEAGFNRLVRKAEEDSALVTITSTYTLDKNRDWSRAKLGLGLSGQRWDEYRNLFRKLNVKGVERKADTYDLLFKENVDGVIFMACSIDFSQDDDLEMLVTQKGYAYSSKELVPLVDSLDSIKMERPGIVYKKLKDHWYLYYELSISKPE